MQILFSFLVLLPEATVFALKFSSTAGPVTPPRSGHTASADANGNVYLFGGYAEHEGASRDVINDLLMYNDALGDWDCVQPETTRDEAPADRPGPRLASASAIIDGEMLMFGGWDPQEAGTGGIILDDVWALDLKEKVWTRCESPMPRGPSSRHVAVNVGGETLVVHTFRCVDSVLVWDKAKRSLVEQKTSGTPPSSRGLHVAAAADEHTMVVFGGAAKDGNMANDAFALDVRTWTWRALETTGEDGAPTPRAGACAASVEGGILVFGGAEAKPEGGLNPRADCWMLSLDEMKWTLLADDAAPAAPGARNAASLSPIGGNKFLLHGGWRPFVNTYGDSHVLEL